MIVLLYFVHTDALWNDSVFAKLLMYIILYTAMRVINM